MTITLFDQHTEEEAALQLAKQVSKLATASGSKGYESFGDDAEQLIADGRLDEVLSTVLQCTELLFSQTSEKDIDGCFAIVGALLKKVPLDRRNWYIKQFAAMVAGSSSHPTLRIKLLAGLFNRIDGKASERYDVFTTTINFAVNAKAADAILNQLKDVDAWIKDWNLDLERTRAVNLLISNAFKDAEKSIESYRYLVKYLASFEGADPGTLGSVKPYAARAAVEAIRIPDLFQMDSLLEMDSVKQLANDATYHREYQLLRIFVLEKLQTYLSFYEKNSAYVSSLGLVHDECVKKMRLLSLCSLAAEHEEIPYDAISSTLQIESGQVEAFVIRAISVKLIEARMDQLRRLVIVTRAMRRVFSPAQWRELRVPLATWRDSIKDVLAVLTKTGSLSADSLVDRLDR